MTDMGFSRPHLAYPSNPISLHVSLSLTPPASCVPTLSASYTHQGPFGLNAFAYLVPSAQQAFLLILSGLFTSSILIREVRPSLTTQSVPSKSSLYLLLFLSYHQTNLFSSFIYQFIFLLQLELSARIFGLLKTA